MLGYSVQGVVSVCACMLIAYIGVCHAAAHILSQPFLFLMANFSVYVKLNLFGLMLLSVRLLSARCGECMYLVYVSC